MSVVAATETNKNDQTNMDAGVKIVAWLIGIPVACFGLLVILLIGGFIWGSATGPSEEQQASEFGTACYTDAKAQFKNPDSANLTDTGVQVVDSGGEDMNFKLEGTGSGMNGFGGYSTVTWTCTGFYSQTSDKAYAHAVVTND